MQSHLGRLRLREDRLGAALGMLSDEAEAPALCPCWDISLLLDNVDLEDVIWCSTQLWHGLHVEFVDTA